MFETSGCPWKEHLFNIEEKLGIKGEILYVIYKNKETDWRIQVKIRSPRTGSSGPDRLQFIFSVYLLAQQVSQIERVCQNPGEESVMKICPKPQLLLMLHFVMCLASLVVPKLKLVFFRWLNSH